MTEKNTPALPVGIFNFENLRRRGFAYADKTDILLNLADGPGRYFLSRPRRFGKSLTLSTLDAMFSGKAELFRGLAAEEWVKRQAAHPCPVLRIDMSTRKTNTPEGFETSLLNLLQMIGDDWGVEPRPTEGCGDFFERLIRSVYRQAGPVVVLIDEYDKPVLDNLQNQEMAEAMRRALRSFYTVVKGCEDYLRFVLLTGISKFTKMGVFSAINNLSDISMDKEFGTLCGYTQAELENDFDGWIDATAAALGLSREELLIKAKEYYDGFSFDGVTRVYNPFSMLQFFQKAAFRNYWYESASPSFIPEYLKRHHEFSLEKFRHTMVSELFIGAHEIEQAAPESFLFQAGYLTIEKVQDQLLTLDYPNKEVLDSLSAMYAASVYKIDKPDLTAYSLWQAFANGDVDQVKLLFNAALASMPYDLFTKADEGFYKAVFLALLRGAGIKSMGEVHSSRGRSDVEVVTPSRVFVIEFKTAPGQKRAAPLTIAALEQIETQGYAEKYAAEGREVVKTAFVVDLEKRAVQASDSKT